MNEYTIPEVEDLMQGFESNNKQSKTPNKKRLEGKEAIDFLLNNKL